MRFPSKLTPIAKSVFSDMCLMVTFLRKDKRGILDCYRWSRRRGWSLQRFLNTVELLYAIGFIELVDNQEVNYVDRSVM